MSKKISGEITVSNDIIAELAARAALESYGVVGLARKGLKGGIGEILKGGTLKKGVSVVKTDKNSVDIHLFVVIEYGVNLVEVSKNLVERVKYEITKYTGVNVNHVEIIVKGVKD